MNVLRTPTPGTFPRRLLSVAILLVLAGKILAAPYFGQSFTYRQPDGEEFRVRLWGDEFFAYQETEDGCLVVRDPRTRDFCYAKVTPDSRNIVSTGVRVGRALPPGLKPKERLSPAAVREKNLERRKQFDVDPSGRPLFPVSASSDGDATDAGGPVVLAPPSSTTTGRRVGLVLLAGFPDRLSETNTISRLEVDAYCNEVGYTGFGNAASIRDYFRIQSNGMLDYTNVVTVYFVASNNRSYYTDPTATYGVRARELVTEGLNALNAQKFDFLQLDADGDGYVDGVNCFYAGDCVNAWQEGLWPHMWSLDWTGFAAFGLNTYARYQITQIGSTLKIGTFAHENGHMICKFPDLYSYNGNAANFGNFCLMANGLYGDGQRHPTHVDAYLKMHAGWSDIVDLDSASHQRCAVQVDRNHVYRYRNPALSTEYFLFEVRDNTGYEGPYGGSSASVNPTAGLVVYHGLQSGNNANGTIFTADNPNCDYSKPYELMVVEAAPTTAYTPWYDDPTPGTTDGFKDSGVKEISDSTFPELKFWATGGRTVTSSCHIHDVSTDGSAMTFVIGTGAVTNPPTMVVNATAFDVYEEAGLQVAAQKFAIYNAGTGTFSYVVSTNVSWLSVSPDSGTVGTEVDQITIACDSVGLSSGAHNGTITITSPDVLDSPQSIDISYTITIIGEASVPVFTEQPAGTHLLGDQSHTLSSWVTGSPEPVRQWYKDGLPIAGATANSLDLVNVTAADAGNYTIVAENSQGVVTSATAVITVDDHPDITMVTPTDVYVGIPSNVGLCLETTVTDDGYGGSSLSFAWTTEGAPVGESVTWDNQTSNNTAAAFSGNGDYTLRITASDGANSVSMDYVVTVGGASSGPTGTVSSANRIVLFELDEGSGTTAIDAAGGNNNGTLSGGAAFIPSAMFDGGVAFDGVNGRITLGTSTEINNGTFPKRTIAFWFKAGDLSGRQLLYEEGGTARGFNFYLDNSTLYWGGWNNNENGWGSSFIAGPTLNAGTWYHVALVLDATPGSTSLEPDAFRVYLNGSLHGTDDAAPINAHTDGIALGGVNGTTKYHSGTPAGDYFDGQVDEFHLYNRALSAAELGILAYAEPNIGPNVDAGASVSGTTGTDVSLDGTVTDDGLPAAATITTEWLRVSGPGSVSFGASGAVDTTAHAASDGTYTLRLTADDTHTKTFDETTIDAYPAVPGILQIDSATYSTGEGGAQVAVQVKRTGGQYGAVSVSYVAVDGTADGSDYSLTPGTLDWAHEEAGLKTILVTITEDAVNEGDETFGVNIHAPTGGASLGTPTNATVTIVENDVSPAAPSALVASAVDRYRIDVTWSDNSDNEDNFLVRRSLTSGSGFGDLALLAGNTTSYADTDVTDNTTYYYTVIATNVYGSALSAAEAGATTPATQHGTLSLSSASYGVDENGASLAITVTRSGGADDAVSVDIDTRDGTAIGGTDYTSLSQTVSWADEEAANKTLIVTILDNGVYQGNRVFYVDLSNPVGDPGLGTTSATVTIVDDEPVPTGARVISQAPVASTPQPPDTDRLTLVFNESIQTSSFSVASDIVAFTGGNGVDLLTTITGHSWANNDTELTISFAPLVSNAVYRMVVGPEILNMAGWPMDQDEDLVLGEGGEDRYAANIWVSTGSSRITLWSDLYGADDTPGPGWTLSNANWQFGDPAENGVTGPSAGSPYGSGTNILAQNLAGNYASGEASHAETPEIDARECTSVYLDFNAWKGMGQKDELYIEVLYDATSRKISSFSKPNGSYNDGAWGANTIDIGADVAGRSFKIRWGLTDVTSPPGVGTGWQLDEILVTGDLGIVQPLPPVVLSHSPAGTFAGSASSVYLDFSQPMDPASFVAADDVTFTDPSSNPIAITGAVWVSSTLLRLDFAEQREEGSYALVLKPTVKDNWEQALNQDRDGTEGEQTEDAYSGGFAIDNDYFIAAPSGLSAVAASSTQVGLSWTDNSGNETGFVIERSLSSGSGFAAVAALPAGSSNYGDQTVSSKTTYFYRLLATNAVAVSEFSSEASATTPKQPATVTLSNLAQTYDGSAKTVSVVTAPPGLTVSVTYDGSPVAPTNTGSYAVLATIDEPIHEGSTNGTLVVEKGTPTVDAWPTAAAITYGQAVSDATLGGGCASVGGTFSYDAPATVPVVGVYTAAVSFIPGDTANYGLVGGGAVEVTVNTPLPATPAGLEATPSPGQVELTWQPVEYAINYNVKRATTTGGPYTTIDATANTNYTDSAVTNGVTYYYVVAATNDSGEGADSTEAVAALLHVLPYIEDFEERTLGALNGQDGWTAENAIVQSTDAMDLQACSITSEVGFASQSFFGSHTTVWTDMQMKPVFSDDAMEPDDPNFTVWLYFDADGHPVAFDGESARCLSNTTVTAGEWVRVTVKSDYTARTWDLYVNKARIARDLGFYSATTTHFTCFEVTGAGQADAILDTIRVDTNPPLLLPATLLLFR